jgi:general secretion pathway protein B
MSYILDALRKADAQRESDPARGIHAQPQRAAVDADPPAGGYRTWFWVASAAGVIALAMAGWYMYRDRGSVTPPPHRDATMAQPARPAMLAPPPAVAQVPAPVIAPAPVVVPAPVIAPAPAPAVAVLPPPVVTAPPPGGRSMARVPSRADRPTMGGTPPPNAPAAAAPAAAIPPAAPMPPVAGLPPDAPKLTITGGVYSANRSQRMLIVNGQVVAEGGDLGSGVTLEEIKPKSVVLVFRGARYTVGY